MDKGICEWFLDSVDCFYETSCGEAFAFNDGDVELNQFKFCPYCGAEIDAEQDCSEDL